MPDVAVNEDPVDSPEWKAATKRLFDSALETPVCSKPLKEKLDSLGKEICAALAESGLMDYQGIHSVMRARSKPEFNDCRIVANTFHQWAREFDQYAYAYYGVRELYRGGPYTYEVDPAAVREELEKAR